MERTHLGDELLELVLLPGLGRVRHHGEHRVVELLVLVVEEDELGPQVRRLGRAQHLRDVQARPEELEVLAHLLGPVLAVEDGELGEHAHVRALEPECLLEQRDELVEVAAVLVVVDELVELVGVHDDVQAAHLREAELLLVDAGEADLLPGLGRVGLASRVDGAGEVAEAHERDGELRVVAHVVVKDLGRLVHLRVEAAVGHEAHVRVHRRRAADQLLHVRQAVGHGEREHQLRLDGRVARLLARHLQVAHQVLPRVHALGNGHHVRKGGRVVRLDVRVDRLLDEALEQLRLGEQRPDGRLVALFGELVRAVQVPDVVHEHRHG